MNDLNGELINFWQVLRTTPDRMLRALWATPLSEDMWREWPLPDTDKVRRATAFFIRSRQSRQGLMKDFATMSKTRTRRGMNEQASSWLTAIEGLPDVHARLQRVVILNRNALDVIRQQDGPKTCFYLDPPYLHETRSTKNEYGENEMTEADHVQLLDALQEVKGAFLLSGYRSRLYDTTADAYGWHRHEMPIVNNAASGKTKKTKVECVWTNFKKEGDV